MKDLKIELEWSTSDLLVWTVLGVGIGFCIVNLITIYNIYSVIETMWLEIQPVKETNISLFQFIEAHNNDFD